MGEDEKWKPMNDPSWGLRLMLIGSMGSLGVLLGWLFSILTSGQQVTVATLLLIVYGAFCGGLLGHASFNPNISAVRDFVFRAVVTSLGVATILLTLMDASSCERLNYMMGAAIPFTAALLLGIRLWSWTERFPDDAHWNVAGYFMWFSCSAGGFLLGLGTKGICRNVSESCKPFCLFIIDPTSFVGVTVFIVSLAVGTDFVLPWIKRQNSTSWKSIGWSFLLGLIVASPIGALFLVDQQHAWPSNASGYVKAGGLTAAAALVTTVPFIVFLRNQIPKTVGSEDPSYCRLFLTSAGFGAVVGLVFGALSILVGQWLNRTTMLWRETLVLHLLGGILIAACLVWVPYGINVILKANRCLLIGCGQSAAKE